MEWFGIFCYIFFAYGCSLIVTQSVGPFGIFIKWRTFTEAFSPNLGLLFRCMLCFPTNLGIVFSLINWFFISLPLTPFNFIFYGTNLWWLAALMDGCLTGGICHIIANIEDCIEKNTPIYEEEEDGK